LRPDQQCYRRFCRALRHRRNGTLHSAPALCSSPLTTHNDAETKSEQVASAAFDLTGTLVPRADESADGALTRSRSSDQFEAGDASINLHDVAPPVSEGRCVMVRHILKKCWTVVWPLWGRAPRVPAPASNRPPSCSSSCHVAARFSGS